jgi:hypothetical protein
MARILVQTTIPFAEDDWHVGRFSLLCDLLSKEHDVVPRNRDGRDDSLLPRIDESGFDQLWLIAVDSGDGLTADECAAIGRFRKRGGGLFVTRDHADLGSSICNLGGVGAAHHFHNHNPDPDPNNRVRDDAETPSIDWPNFHSGSNGDVQEVEAVGAIHDVLRRADGSPLRYFPAHPHEGAVSAPAADPTARVIVRGHSQSTRRAFNIAVAFDSLGDEGNALAESTFHHFCDYNWDVRLGCPTFVTEPPSQRIVEHPELLDDIKAYSRNVARWLSKGGRG